jgi:hypothetical protein
MGVLRQSIICNSKAFSCAFDRCLISTTGMRCIPSFFAARTGRVFNHYLAGIINHNRYDNPELADAISDLIDLTLRMLSRIAGIQSEILHNPILDLNLDQTGIGRGIASSFGGGLRSLVSLVRPTYYPTLRAALRIAIWRTESVGRWFGGADFVIAPMY